MMTDQEINERIDQIQAEACNLSSEARNALHACRPRHPLGCNEQRAYLFLNAAHVLYGCSSVSSHHIVWLRNMATAS